MIVLTDYTLWKLTQRGGAGHPFMCNTNMWCVCVCVCVTSVSQKLQLMFHYSLTTLVKRPFQPLILDRDRIAQSLFSLIFDTCHFASVTCVCIYLCTCKCMIMCRQVSHHCRVFFSLVCLVIDIEARMVYCSKSSFLLDC